MTAQSTSSSGPKWRTATLRVHTRPRPCSRGRASEGSRMSHPVHRPADDASLATTGERVSMLMANQGITSRALAESLGIQESTLANFRHGHRGIPSAIVSEMARKLDTNVPFLLEHSQDARPSAEILEDIRLREESYRQTS